MVSWYIEEQAISFYLDPAYRVSPRYRQGLDHFNNGKPVDLKKVLPEL